MRNNQIYERKTIFTRHPSIKSKQVRTEESAAREQKDCRGQPSPKGKLAVHQANIGQGSVAIVIGDDLMRVLNQLPKECRLFPTLAEQNDKVRSSRFRKRCDRLGFKDISLHGYRYAWAQRAKTFGMPLREAMAPLGSRQQGHPPGLFPASASRELAIGIYEKAWKEKIVQFQHAASR